MSSPLILAQTESALTPLERACGEDPSEVCSWLIGQLQGSVWLTIVIDRILMVPVIIIVAFILYRLFRRWTDRFVRRIEEDIHRRVRRARELSTRAASHSAETRRLQRLPRRLGRDPAPIPANVSATRRQGTPQLPDDLTDVALRPCGHAEQSLLLERGSHDPATPGLHP